MTPFIHQDPDIILDSIMSHEAELHDPSIRMSPIERTETRANIVRLQSVLQDAYAYQSKRRASGGSSQISLIPVHL